MGKNEAVGAGRQQKSKRVAFLQQTRKNSSPLYRYGFHRQPGADAPPAPHADTVKQSQYQERGVVGGETGKYFNERVIQDVDDQRNTPAVAVRQETKQNSPDPA